MIKTVQVTYTKEIEIDLDESILTTEHIEEFERYIGSFDDADTHEEKVNELFKFAARCVFDEQSQHVEGLGDAVPKYMKQFNEKAVVLFYSGYEDIETEIVE